MRFLLDACAASRTMRETLVSLGHDVLFVRRLPHPCIIRFTEMSVAEKVAAMSELIEGHTPEILDRSIIVVTPRRVRIRRGERGQAP